MTSPVPEMFFQCQIPGFSRMFRTVRAALLSQGGSCCISVPPLPTSVHRLPHEPKPVLLPWVGWLSPGFSVLGLSMQPRKDAVPLQ